MSWWAWCNANCRLNMILMRLGGNDPGAALKAFYDLYSQVIINARLVTKWKFFSCLRTFFIFLQENYLRILLWLTRYMLHASFKTEVMVVACLTRLCKQQHYHNHRTAFWQWFTMTFWHFPWKFIYHITLYSWFFANSVAIHPSNTCMKMSNFYQIVILMQIKVI